MRKALFQIHLWSGIALGLYILMISVTGSVLVYWNELYLAATPEPIITKGSGPRLTDSQLTAAARLRYPGYRVIKVTRSRNLDEAVDIGLERGNRIKHRLFDPRSGSDLGDSVSTGMRLVSFILDLHDNLLAGQTGRTVNGVGAFAVLAVVVSGMVIWWPGSKTWRRSLKLPRGVGWKSLNWHLHSMIGFWSFAFTLVFIFSGIYLCFPDRVQDFADRLQPLTAANARDRLVDQVIYWLAYLHFGRINGIGIPCRGPGICDQTTKAVWALFGLAPAAMFVTGAIMWWNRVLRPRMLSARRMMPVRTGPMLGSQTR
ncbi:MAG TPA: PepSY-associated TM helix domain-containing protein [Bryobacteraceae bacterium]|nr:PepSY-associated TM helix domain-containing protein [Bryobacteraceae bacterium]